MTSMATPRVVLVTRRTEYDELIARHGTRGQADFFLRSRGNTASRHVEWVVRGRGAVTVRVGSCRVGFVERVVPVHDA